MTRKKSKKSIGLQSGVGAAGGVEATALNSNALSTLPNCSAFPK